MNLTSVASGLGGPDNIVDLLACATRIRVEVADPKKVDESQLRESGALGVVRAQQIVQLVIGPEAEHYTRLLQDMITPKA